MGDLLMSSPAITALKETFGCHITLLTSSMAKGIASYLPAVDACIVWDVPWVKGIEAMDVREFWKLVEELRSQQFDAAVIFTVFSQNPLPTALLLMLAGIPRRLAYCREYPYRLLTEWLPDEEPYRLIRHQVRRDLNLVKAVGAQTTVDTIRIIAPSRCNEVMQKMRSAGVNPERPWLVLHPGVSEKKREYPLPLWIKTGKKIVTELGYQLVITGAEKEHKLVSAIAQGIGRAAFDLSGTLSLEELIELIRLAPLIVSVNTGPAHLAAAVQTKVVVLYALTNPQHAPWKSTGIVLPYSVAPELQSQNQVLRFLQDEYSSGEIISVSTDDIVGACYDLLVNGKDPLIEEIVLPKNNGHAHGSRKALNFKEP